MCNKQAGNKGIAPQNLFHFITAWSEGVLRVFI